MPPDNVACTVNAIHVDLADHGERKHRHGRPVG